MSWVDQCKMAFFIKAETLFAERKITANNHNRLVNKVPIFKALSKESGLSINMLKRWHWEIKNNKPFPLCERCDKYHIKIKNTSFVPSSHGMCGGCVNKHYKQRKKEAPNEQV